jgi:hypothetical protein
MKCQLSLDKLIALILIKNSFGARMKVSPFCSTGVLYSTEARAHEHLAAPDADGGTAAPI